MLRVGLVQCYGSMQPANAEPLSVETLAGAVKESLGNQVKLDLFTLEEREDNSWAKLANTIKEENIGLIGVSIPQSCLKIALRFLSAVYTQDQSRLMVLGHALPTHLPDLFLQKFPESIIVRGWGEESFTTIVRFYLENTKEYEKIPNLIFIRNGEIVKTEIKWPVASPRPLRDLSSGFFARVEASRGCHYDVCTFCTRQPKQVNFKRWHRIKLDDVKRELSILKTLGIKNFTFTDEDFIGDDLEGAERLADYLINLKDMRFSISLRVDNIINPGEESAVAEQRIRLINKLKVAGLSRIFLGVESLSNSQLRRYGKGVKAQDSVNSIQALRNIGVSIEIGFILFDPFLTIDELKENLYWLQYSSLWKFVGQLFNHLRIQVDAPITKLMKSRALLGTFQPDSLDFKYQYSDINIGKIARFCIDWKEDIDGVYALARNISRSEMGNTVCDDFVQDIKILQIKLLTDILTIYQNQNELLFPETIKQKQLLVQKLNDDIQKGIQFIKSHAGRELCEEIERYLKRSI